MYKYKNKQILLEIDELPKEIQNFALHSFIEKSKLIHTKLIVQLKSKDIHWLINNRYTLNNIKQSFTLLQNCKADLRFCRKVVKDNLCLFTLQGVYSPFMYNV